LAIVEEKRRKRVLLKKIAVGVLLLVLVTLTVLLLNINTIVRIGTNKALNHYLVAGGEIEAVDIRVLEGRAALSGLIIHPPPGFEPHPLLALDRVDVDVAPWALLKGKVVIENLVVKGLSLNIIRDKKGQLSPLKLMAARTPGTEPQPESQPIAETSPWIPVVHAHAIQVEDVSFRLAGRMLENDWSASLNAGLKIEGLRIEDLLNLDILVGRVDLKLNDILVDQPPGFSREPLLAANRINVTSRGIDLNTSIVPVSDVVLDKLSVSLERNSDRGVNIIELAESWLPAEKGDDSNQSDPVPAPPESSRSGLKLPAVVVDNMQLNAISAQLLVSIEDKPWRAGFDGLDILIRGADAGVKAEQAVSLASFDLDLKGISVDQPPGFDDSKLFGLEQFTVISDKTITPGQELVIKAVNLEGLTSSIIMRADGKTNIQVLSQVLLERDEAARLSKEEKEPGKKQSSAKAVLQPVLFEEIVMNGGQVVYRDEVFAEEPLEANLDDIQMEIKGLHLFTDRKDVKPASASISFELAQPGELPTAYFGTLAEVGPVGDGIPMVNSQVRLVGLKLDTLGTLVPKTTRSALGATGLDAGLAMALDADSINLNASVLTDRNIRYQGITVQGPLNTPVVKTGPVMAGVFGRVSEGMVNMGKSGFKSGVDIAAGGAEAAKELGTGAVKIGANLGKSLFSTTAGVVTLNKEKVKAGASGTTKGTMDLTRDSVKGSGTAAGGSLKRSASDLKGENRVKAWEADIPARYQTSMAHARTVLADMPYPPVTE